MTSVVDPTRPQYFVSVDWSLEPAKRAVHVADVARRRVRREFGSWHLASLLALAQRLARDGDVLVGLDLALGVPTWLAACGGVATPTFPDWLAAMAGRPGFFESVTRAGDWSPRQPFFRVPSGKGSLTAFRDAAGGPLCREIDSATAAKSPFIVSGIPGSVGSATRAFWRELVPHLSAERPFALWPFERDRATDITVAETYPGIAYGVALADELPSGRLLVAKTRSVERERYCDRLRAAGWIDVLGVDVGDDAAACDDEDVFDSWITAVAVLRCLVTDCALVDPRRTDVRFEGGMLLSGAVHLDRPGRRFSSTGRARTARDAPRR